MKEFWKNVFFTPKQKGSYVGHIMSNRIIKDPTHVSSKEDK